jgi:hypothetical protein
MKLRDEEDVRALRAMSNELDAVGGALFANSTGARAAESSLRAEHQELLMGLFRRTAILKQKLVTEHLVRPQPLRSEDNAVER